MVDKVDPLKILIERFGEDFLASELPSAAALYYKARNAYQSNDMRTAKIYENLIHILHDSHIPSTAEIGIGLNVAYKGIGVLVHYNSKIGDYVTLGTNVTLGSAPCLKDHVYISTGARVIGPSVTIGPFSIVGANAVVKKSVPPFTIVAGVPAKEVGKITEINLDKYLEYFCAGKKSDTALVESVRLKALQALAQSQK
jgi:serine acetyltransferase